MMHLASPLGLSRWTMLLAAAGFVVTASAQSWTDAESLTIEKFKYRPKYMNFAYSAKATAVYRSRVLIHGEMVFGEGNDGIDFATDEVRISIGDLIQVIPADQFRGVGNRPRVFKGRSLNALRKVALRATPTGLKFSIAGSKLQMATPETFTLQIGDDVGQYDLVAGHSQSPARSFIIGQLVDGESADGIRRAVVRVACPQGICSDISINGRFRLEASPGVQLLTIDGALALDAARARFSRSVAAAPGTTDIGIVTLPRMDLSSAAPIPPGTQSQTSTVRSASLSTGGTAEVAVGAGATVVYPPELLLPQELTLTEVAQSSLPAQFPANTWGPVVLTLQPEGTAINPCADLTLDNPFAGLSDGATVELFGFDGSANAFSSIGVGTIADGATKIRAPGVICRGGWIFPACVASVTDIVGTVEQGGAEIAGLSLHVAGATATTVDLTDLDGDGDEENFRIAGLSAGCSGAPTAVSALARTTGPGFGMQGAVTDLPTVPSGVSDAGDVQLDLAICGEKVAEWAALMESPQDLALDAADNIYVANFGKGTIRKFDPSGTLILEWGGEGSGPGQFDYGPLRIEVDANGVVHASDIEPRSQKFDTDGNRLGALPSFGYGPTQISDMRGGMAADSLGNLYVLESNSLPFIVHKFDAAGTLVDEWGDAGSQPGQLASARGIAVGPDDTVFIADSENNRVQHFDADGSFLNGFGSQGFAPGKFEKPGAIAIDDVGNIYVADGFRGDFEAGIPPRSRIQRFDADFNFVHQWENVISTEPGELGSVAAVETDSMGNLLVLEAEGRIQKFDPDGDLLLEIGTFRYNPSSIAIDPAGYVHVRDIFIPNRVVTFDPNGVFLGRFPTTTTQSLAVDWDGNVYTANGCRIEKYNRNHELVLEFPLPPGAPEGDCHSTLLDVDQRGHVYAYFVATREIWKFDDQGNFLLSWDGSGQPGGRLLSVVYSLAADSRGFVYVSESVYPKGPRIRKFDAFGEEIGHWYAEDVGVGSFPSSRFHLDADPHGNLYVAEVDGPGAHHARVFVYDSSVSYLGHWGIPTLDPGGPTTLLGISVDGLGNVYIVDNNTRILRYSCPD